MAAGVGIPNPFWEEVSRDDTIPHAITDTVNGSQLQISLHHSFLSFIMGVSLTGSVLCLDWRFLEGRRICSLRDGSAP